MTFSLNRYYGFLLGQFNFYHPAIWYIGESLWIRFSQEYHWAAGLVPQDNILTYVCISEVCLAVIFILNAVVNVLRYVLPILSASSVELTEHQRRLLGVKENGKEINFWRFYVIINIQSVSYFAVTKINHPLSTSFVFQSLASGVSVQHLSSAGLLTTALAALSSPCHQLVVSPASQATPLLPTLAQVHSVHRQSRPPVHTLLPSPRTRLHSQRDLAASPPRPISPCRSVLSVRLVFLCFPIISITSAPYT